MKNRIAVVTSVDLPDLFGGEKLLIAALEQQQLAPQIVIWDDPLVDWKQFDLILIRCTWDYHEKLDTFRAWLSMLSDWMSSSLITYRPCSGIWIRNIYLSCRGIIVR